MRLGRLFRLDKDVFNSAKRALGQGVDQLIAPALKKLTRQSIVPFHGPTRFSLLTVNFSTTYYLKLMLLTLCEQDSLSSLRRIVIVDNNSKDGGIDFIEQLAEQNKAIHLLKNRLNCTHANGLRKAIAYVDQIEQRTPAHDRSNALLICDTDIVFRDSQTLGKIGSVLTEDDTAFTGELRQGMYPYPEAQASFFAIRRDCYARPDIKPIVYHGAPAYFMQRSLWKAGLKLAHFPSNHGGYILHRGRSGVAAARKYHQLSSYATTANHAPHFMGVESGEKIWAEIEQRYGRLLDKQQEPALLNHLHEHLGDI